MREPADLAWVTRDTIVLMAMQRSNKSVELKDKHNLRQLDGFIRLWIAGYTSLTGQNSFRKFDLRADSFTNIVLVSVVNGDEAGLRVIRDPAGAPSKRPSQVTVTVSIAEGLLVRLAELGGTALDLADLVLWASQVEGGVSESDASEWLERSKRESIARANAVQPTPADESHATYSTRANLLTLRNFLGTQVTKDGTFPTVLTTLNDLDWEDVELISLAAGVVVGEVQRAPREWPAGFRRDVTCGEYRFLITANDAELAPQSAWRIKEELDTHPETVAINFFMTGRSKTDYNPVMVLAGNANPPTSTGLAFRMAGAPIEKS